MENNARIYLSIFDELFFFGSIGRRCTITWSSLGPCTLGRCTPIQYGLETHCIIELDIKFTGDVVSDKNLLLETLLHEMCHAFLEIYACHASECFLEREHGGVTGHGRAWEMVATAAQNTANRNFHLQLDLNIASSVERDRNSRRQSWCNFMDEQLEKAEEDFEELEDCLDESESDSDSDW
jgi:hypothetical protein